MQYKDLSKSPNYSLKIPYITQKVYYIFYVMIQYIVLYKANICQPLSLININQSLHADD